MSARNESATDTATRGSGDDWAVVVNHEDQWSVWPADRCPPAGWTTGGFTGSREECLAHITTVWTDLRPLSIRRRTAAD